MKIFLKNCIRIYSYTKFWKFSETKAKFRKLVGHTNSKLNCHIKVSPCSGSRPQVTIYILHHISREFCIVISSVALKFSRRYLPNFNNYFLLSNFQTFLGINICSGIIDWKTKSPNWNTFINILFCLSIFRSENLT